MPRSMELVSGLMYLSRLWTQSTYSTGWLCQHTRQVHHCLVPSVMFIFHVYQKWWNTSNTPWFIDATQLRFAEFTKQRYSSRSALYGCWIWRESVVGRTSQGFGIGSLSERASYLPHSRGKNLVISRKDTCNTSYYLKN